MLEEPTGAGNVDGAPSPEGGWVMRVDVPSIVEDSVSVSVACGVVKIEGRKRMAFARGSGTNEARLYGRFLRYTRLPAHVDPDRVSVRVRGTTLEVHAPLAEVIAIERPAPASVERMELALADRPAHAGSNIGEALRAALFRGSRRRRLGAGG
jgi:hypothetical protein